MAKAQSFADKMARAHTIPMNECPTCGTTKSYVLQVASEKPDGRESWKFNQKMVSVCKCNEQEIYG